MMICDQKRLNIAAMWCMISREARNEELFFYPIEYNDKRALTERFEF